MKFRVLAGIAVLFASITLTFTQVMALPTVDGRFNPGEGYTNGYTVTFALDNGQNATDGQLWTYQDGSNLYLAFLESKSLNDNSYDIKGGTSGEYHTVGWDGKDHKFDQLLGSDEAVFDFLDASGNTLIGGVKIDYLAETSRGSGVYNAEVKESGGADVVAATSLQYNFETYGGSYPTLFGKDSYSPEVVSPTSYEVVNPDLAGWVFDITYELRISSSLLDRFSSLVIRDVHNSPAKIGYKSITIDPMDPPGSEPVPEPATVLLMVTGLAGGVATRIRRSRRDA